MLKLNEYKRLSQSNWGIGAHGMKIIYKAIVEPIMLYGAPALEGRITRAEWQESIVKIQRCAMIAISRAYKSVSNEALTGDDWTPTD